MMCRGAGVGEQKGEARRSSEEGIDQANPPFVRLSSLQLRGGGGGRDEIKGGERALPGFRGRG